MHKIKGRYRDGQIILAEKADWPQDTEVIVEPIVPGPAFGMREEDWSDTPESIDDWLRWYDSLDSFLTPEEEAKWRAALQAQKDFETAAFEDRARRIERLFE